MRVIGLIRAGVTIVVRGALVVVRRGSGVLIMVAHVELAGNGCFRWSGVVVL